MQRLLHRLRALVFATVCAGCSSLTGLDDFSIAETGSGGSAGMGGMGGTTTTAPVGGGGGDTGGGGATGGTTTIDIPITDNERDAWDDEQSGALDACNFGDSFYRDYCGLQFRLPVPPGATIVDATISVTPYMKQGDAGLFTPRLLVEDIDEPAVFSGALNDIAQRVFAAPIVPWPDASSLPFMMRATSPSITSLVQHVVNRPGWRANNHIHIVIAKSTESVGGAAVFLRDYSNDQANAASLYISYLE